MDYSLVENEIVNHLRAFPSLVSTADILVYPEGLNEMKDPYEKGCIYVILAGDKYGPNQSVSEISQTNNSTFALSIKSKFRSGPVGVYTIKNLIANRLLGFRPTDCGALTIGSFEFQAYERDIWEYVLLVSCSSLRSQMFENKLPGENVTGQPDDVFYKPKV